MIASEDFCDASLAISSEESVVKGCCESTQLGMAKAISAAVANALKSDVFFERNDAKTRIQCRSRQPSIGIVVNSLPLFGKYGKQQ